MKGLLYKDAHMLIGQYRLLLVVALAMLLIPGFTTNIFILVFAAAMPVTALAMDEQSGFLRFAAALPLTRRQIILEKYLLGLLLTLAASVLALWTSWILGRIKGIPIGPDDLLCLTGALSVTLLMQALSMPMMFKWGVERGRLYLMLTMALTIGGLTGFNMADPEKSAQLFQGAYALLLPTGALILLALSACLSIFIFRKRAL